MSDDDVESETIEYWLGKLRSPTPSDRARALQGLAARPIADPRLLERAEQLLEERTMTVLSIPYSFGEVRWCAADAVAALREALSVDTPVLLEQVFAPCTSTEVERLAVAAGVEHREGGVDGILRTLEALSAMQRLPRRTIHRVPRRPDDQTDPK